MAVSKEVKLFIIRQLGIKQTAYKDALKKMQEALFKLEGYLVTSVYHIASDERLKKGYLDDVATMETIYNEFIDIKKKYKDAIDQYFFVEGFSTNKKDNELKDDVKNDAKSIKERKQAIYAIRDFILEQENQLG